MPINKTYYVNGYFVNLPIASTIRASYLIKRGLCEFHTVNEYFLCYSTLSYGVNRRYRLIRCVSTEEFPNDYHVIDNLLLGNSVVSWTQNGQPSLGIGFRLKGIA